MHRESRSIKRRKNTRRGSVYVAVLGTALIVSVLGLSALMIQRIQRKADQQAAHVVEARLYADAALRIGMLRIENDPEWRFNYPNGAWETDVPIGDGTYTLEGIDPSDGDLSDRATDPLVLIGHGKKGTAVQKVQITLLPEYRGYSCLESAMHSGLDVLFNSATVQCDQTISADQNVTATSSAVYSDVAAAIAVSGSTYYGATEEGIQTRDFPTVADAFDYYLTNGTYIDKDSLPLGFANVLRNPGIENSLDPWQPWESSPGNPACDIAVDTAEYHSGAASLKVTNRTSYQAGPLQHLEDIIQSGVTYECTAWVKMRGSNTKVAFVLDVTSSGEGAQSWVSGDQQIKVNDGWTLFQRELTPTFTGTVSVATLKIESKNGQPVNDFYVDDWSFKEKGSERTIYQEVLSPNSNPFGGPTNPRGIYVIDMAGSTIVVKNSRIVGTLVLINPNVASAIGDGGPLTWEPAVAGFPALMVKDQDVTINPSTAGLVEYANNTNFNPTGTPYDGLGEDSDEDDTYASEIKGLIYSNKKIKFYQHPVITGAVLANDNIEINDQLDLTHNPVYFFSPPPGFNGPEEIKILLGSAKRKID